LLSIPSCYFLFYSQAKIPEFKACAVQVFLAREEELPNPDIVVEGGLY
jgi:hypothetical protein